MTRSGLGWAGPRVPRLVRGLGVLLAVLLLEELVPPAGGSLGVANAGIIGSTAPFVAVLVYGSYWLERSQLGPAQYSRLLAWCLAGVGTSLVLNVAVMFANPPAGPRSAFGWLRLAVAAGGAIGLVVGAIEGRTIERGRRAERNAVRAEMAEERSEWLDYVNSLLRHEVLNTVTVVDGYTGYVLREHDLPADAVDRLETVRRQSQNMASVISDVRGFIEATQGDVELAPVELTPVIEHAVADVRDRHGEAVIETSLPTGTTVIADDLLERVFSNLLANAVEHNDSDVPCVRVDAGATDETVTVRVEDDGPGIPPDRRESLFERETGRDHGLGLYLVDTLVERYGGSVELTETGPEGSVFTVELRRAAAANAASTDADEPAGAAASIEGPEPGRAQ